MNRVWYSLGTQPSLFFDFRWSKLLFTVFFSLHILCKTCSLKMLMALHLLLSLDIIRSQLDAISFYITMAELVLEIVILESLHRLIATRWWFLSSCFLCVFYYYFSKIKFKECENSKGFVSFSYKCFAFDICMLSIHLLNRSIHQAHFIIFHPFHQTNSSSNHLMKR